MHNSLHIQLPAEMYFKKFNICSLLKWSTPEKRTEGRNSLASSYKVLLVFLNYFR